MSPILVRPVREQFEHDRIIRVLQARYKRKYEVFINPGAEQNASISIGELAMYPDLVLFSAERGRKVQGTVEVETTESINTLEAMAEWGPFSRLRAAFFLYVPATSLDTVRRLCTEHGIAPSEIWTYHAAMDQMRFTMVQRTPDTSRVTDSRAPRFTITKPPLPVDARPVPAAPAVASGANGSEAKVAEARPRVDRVDRMERVDKAKRDKKPAPRVPTAAAKTAKKAAAVKKPPRAAAGRHRPVPKKTAARKSPAKRSATPKR